MTEILRYYDYHSRPLKIVRAPNGGLRAYLLDTHTGRFELANSALRKTGIEERSDDIFTSDEEECIELAESNRSRFLRGDGPIFALYKLVNDIRGLADVVDKQTWDLLRRPIYDIRHRTFQLWKEEFARRDAGQPPSFHYEAVGGPGAVEKYSRPDPTPDITATEASRWFNWYRKLPRDPNELPP